MTTIANLVDRIERGLLVHYTRPLYDTPSASYTNTQATIALTSTEQIGPGALLDVNFELMYVRSWNEALRTATVIRGFLGTTAVAGTGTSLVRINPRFTTPAMYDAIVDELNSWDEQLFAVQLESVNFGASAVTAPLNPTRAPYRILYARPRNVTTEDHRYWVTGRLLQSEPSALYPTGYSFALDGSFAGATTVDFAYAVPFDLTGLTDSTALEATHGLTAGMLEILKWGAMARVTPGKEAARLDPQTVVRPDLEQAVPATALLQAGAQYQRMRDQAYEREARKLLARWPWRF